MRLDTAPSAHTENHDIHNETADICWHPEKVVFCTGSLSQDSREAATGCRACFGHSGRDLRRNSR